MMHSKKNRFGCAAAIRIKKKKIKGADEV